MVESDFFTNAWRLCWRKHLHAADAHEYDDACIACAGLYTALSTAYARGWDEAEREIIARSCELCRRGSVPVRETDRLRKFLVWNHQDRPAADGFTPNCRASGAWEVRYQRAQEPSE